MKKKTLLLMILILLTTIVLTLIFTTFPTPVSADPRVFVLDKEGRIVYAEKEGDERIMSLEFLLEKLK